MFTGIIEEVGSVASIRKGNLSSTMEIGAKLIFRDMKIGDSIAVNGVCLTVTNFSSNIFSCDVMETTLKSSDIGNLLKGSLVNLERALLPTTRLGGHIVTGHIDGTGVILSMSKKENAILYTISTSPNIIKYIVNKGSIAIDGISLTVTNVLGNNFSVSIIPHTALVTTLSTKSVGGIVNLENDIIGKYVERLINFNNSNEQNKINTEFLSKYGFI